ncbi:hypothetical protein DSUL_100120 [Desulfovibrionales bacterium]
MSQYNKLFKKKLILGRNDTVWKYKHHFYFFHHTTIAQFISFAICQQHQTEYPCDRPRSRYQNLYLPYLEQITISNSGFH